MKRSCNRREFLKRVTSAGIGFGVLGGLDWRFAWGANDRLQVAVAGVNSRGQALAESFALAGDAQVAYVCDVDTRAVAKTVESVAALQERRPKGAGDFRKVLEDPFARRRRHRDARSLARAGGDLGPGRRKARLRGETVQP